MKKTRLLILGLVSLILALSTSSCEVLDKLISKQENSIFALKSQIVSMKFDVTKVSDKEMLVNYAFYNLAGQKVGEEKSVKVRGSELFIDCRVEKLNSKYSIVFPYAFYSNLIPVAQGRVIVNDYNNGNDYPEIFVGVSYSEKRKIARLYENILNDTPTSKSFRSSPHIVINEANGKYKLVSRVRGGIEILRAE